jgi:hypothetical protein
LCVLLLCVQVALDGTPIPVGLSKAQAKEFRWIRSLRQRFGQHVLNIQGDTRNDGGRIPMAYGRWNAAQRTAYAWLFRLCMGSLYALLVFLKLFGIHGGAGEMSPGRFDREAL